MVSIRSGSKWHRVVEVGTGMVHRLLLIPIFNKEATAKIRA